MKTWDSLESQIKNVKGKIDVLTAYIQTNTRAPDWSAKVSEKNALSVKLESLRQQKRNDWNNQSHPQYLKV
jgi:hypothetical protein